MKRLQYRQGDVLLLQCDALPQGAIRERRGDRIVLAYGEATGHAHAVSTLAAEEFRVSDDRYLRVHNFTNLVHEEHAPLTISPGLYKIIRQQEYMPRATSYVDD